MAVAWRLHVRAISKEATDFVTRILNGGRERRPTDHDGALAFLQ